jgi:hypothetical protein
VHLDGFADTIDKPTADQSKAPSFGVANQCLQCRMLRLGIRVQYPDTSPSLLFAQAAKSKINSTSISQIVASIDKLDRLAAREEYAVIPRLSFSCVFWICN